MQRHILRFTSDQYLFTMLRSLHDELNWMEYYYSILAYKAGYKPTQPRVPAGNPNGGQWTDDEDTSQPNTLHPDDPFAEDPPLEPVYPELLVLPYLGVGRLYQVWRVWVFSRRVNAEWRLGSYKSDKRWANQIRKRDWTPEQITKTIKYGKRHKAPNLVNPANTATRYEYNGKFVVRDDKTKEILQLGHPDFVRKVK